MSEEKHLKKNYDNTFNFAFLIPRLTPALMLSLLVEVAFFKYFGDGPQWPYAGIEYDECKKSWWWNLLYINNFDVRKNVPAVR